MMQVKAGRARVLFSTLSKSESFSLGGSKDVRSGCISSEV